MKPHVLSTSTPPNLPRNGLQEPPLASLILARNSPSSRCKPTPASKLSYSYPCLGPSRLGHGQSTHTHACIGTHIPADVLPGKQGDGTSPTDPPSLSCWIAWTHRRTHKDSEEDLILLVTGVAPGEGLEQVWITHSSQSCRSPVTGPRAIRVSGHLRQVPQWCVLGSSPRI